MEFSILPKPYNFPKPYETSNSLTTKGVELGRFLFYDPILSRDSTFSCGSCHRQEVAFSDAPNQFSKGINGELTKRNTMPLYNLAWYERFFWDGRANSIEDQVFEPVRKHSEMDLNWKIAEERIRRNQWYKSKFLEVFGNVAIDSALIAKAIGQFERVLISHHSKYDSVIRGEAKFTMDEFQGFVLVNDQSMADCLHCHITDAHALGTSGKFSNNGIQMSQSAKNFQDNGLGDVTGEIKDLGKFRIPSLRNIAVTAPYMHDGRFNTLREVLDYYSSGLKPSFNIDSKMQSAHRGGVQLTEEEKDQIIAFLNTLTDSVFLTNPNFSNPFNN
jgi:cytochrome c peroxidase